METQASTQATSDKGFGRGTAANGGKRLRRPGTKPESTGLNIPKGVVIAPDSSSKSLDTRFSTPPKRFQGPNAKIGRGQPVKHGYDDMRKTWKTTGTVAGTSATTDQNTGLKMNKNNLVPSTTPAFRNTGNLPKPKPLSTMDAGTQAGSGLAKMTDTGHPQTGGLTRNRPYGKFVKGFARTLTGIGSVLTPLYNAEIAQMNNETALEMQSNEHNFKSRLERGRYKAAVQLQSKYQQHALKRMYVDFSHRTALIRTDLESRSSLAAEESSHTMNRQKRIENLYTSAGLPAFMAHSGTGDQGSLRTTQYLGARTTRSFLPTNGFYNHSYAQGRYGVGEVDVSRFGQNNYRNTMLSDIKDAPKKEKKKKGDYAPRANIGILPQPTH